MQGSTDSLPANKFAMSKNRSARLTAGAFLSIREARLSFRVSAAYFTISQIPTPSAARPNTVKKITVPVVVSALTKP